MGDERRYLVAGAGGQLARSLVEELSRGGRNVRAESSSGLDITDGRKVQSVLDEYHPDVVLNGAAFNLVDDAEADPDRAFAVNSEAVGRLAALCRRKGIQFVHFSTDYVFDGTKGTLYTEDDEPNPISAYARSKLEGERAALKEAPDALVFRVSWVFGEGQSNFLYKLAQWDKTRDVLNIADDETSSPTYSRDAAPVVLKAVERGLKGLYHLSNSGYCSRYELARFYFQCVDKQKTLIPVKAASFGLKAKRPAFSAMSHWKLGDVLGITMPGWQDAVGRFLSTKPFERS